MIYKCCVLLLLAYWFLFAMPSNLPSLPHRPRAINIAMYLYGVAHTMYMNRPQHRANLSMLDGDLLRLGMQGCIVGVAVGWHMCCTLSVSLLASWFAAACPNTNHDIHNGFLKHWWPFGCLHSCLFQLGQPVACASLLWGLTCSCMMFHLFANVCGTAMWAPHRFSRPGGLEVHACGHNGPQSKPL